MSTQAPKHKVLYEKTLDPGYGPVPEIKEDEIDALFQEFHQKLLDSIPASPPPKDEYMHGNWMGALGRQLVVAKHMYVDALKAYYRERGANKKQKV